MPGKIALVTGSTSGIGLGIAHCLADSGNDVILTGLGDQKMKEDILAHFKSTYKGTFNFVDGNLSTDEGVASVCRQVMKLYPDGIDILINNAGIQHVAPVDGYPVETWHKMVAINLTAPFLLIRHFLPFMKKKGWGRIVSTASVAALISQPGKAPYSSTKAGIVGMTKGVALECAEFGVTCNAICPAYVNTEIARKQINDLAAARSVSVEVVWNEIFHETHPTKKPVTVEQVASFVNYLCSEDASSITGTALTVDGGYTAQ